MRALLAFLMLTSVAIAQEQSGAAVSGDFFNDPRVTPAISGLMNAVMDRCESGSGDSRVCLSRTTISAVEYGPEIAPNCQGYSAFINEFFCLLMGASGVDLVVASGAGDKLVFLQEHGRDGERVINAAGASVIKFLAKTCSEASGSAGCGPREAAKRLHSRPEDQAICASLSREWDQVTCLMTSRVVENLRQAKGRV